MNAPLLPLVPHRKMKVLLCQPPAKGDQRGVQHRNSSARNRTWYCLRPKSSDSLSVGLRRVRRFTGEQRIRIPLLQNRNLSGTQTQALQWPGGGGLGLCPRVFRTPPPLVLRCSKRCHSRPGECFFRLRFGCRRLSFSNQIIK